MAQRHTAVNCRSMEVVAEFVRIRVDRATRPARSLTISATEFARIENTPNIEMGDSAQSEQRCSRIRENSESPSLTTSATEPDYLGIVT